MLGGGIIMEKKATKNVSIINGRANKNFEALKKNGFEQFNMDFMFEVAKNTSSSAAFVYMALVKHYNAKTYLCYPSHETLADETGTSKSSVIRYLKELKKAGYIDWEVSNNFKCKNDSNLYMFLFPSVAKQAVEEVVEDRIEEVKVVKATKEVKKAKPTMEIPKYDVHTNVEIINTEEKKVVVEVIKEAETINRKENLEKLFKEFEDLGGYMPEESKKRDLALTKDDYEYNRIVKDLEQRIKDISTPMPVMRF
jgi:predicted transcriptional regulator